MSLALAALVCAAQGASLARTSSIPLGEERRIDEVLSVGLSGDDVSDLLVATRGTGGRRLAVHVRRGSGPAFLPAPDAEIAVTPDVLAFAAADVLPDPGREVLLYNATGVFAWRWRAAEEEGRIVRLVDCDLLWQLAAEGTLFHLQAGVVDLDDDGREDLLIPEPEGVRIALQAPADGASRFRATTFLRIPADRSGPAPGDPAAVSVRTTAGPRRLELNLGSAGIGLDAGGARTYLSIEEEAPAPRTADFDGDGDLDVLALTDGTLHVLVQEPRGVFDPGRVLRFASPVPRDRRRSLDISFRVEARDLDADGRVDCVFFAQDQRSADARTQALVFLQSGVAAGEPALFGSAGLPRQLLVLDGIARPLAIEDVDGDGLPDLVAAALRPDLIDALRAAASARVDTELYVYRGRGAAGFSQRPDLVRVLSLSAAGRGRDTFFADFTGDVTGDGVRELFTRADPERLRAHMVRRTREGALAVVDAPLWELAIDAEARVLMPDVLGPRTPDLFVLERRSIVCASFR